MSIEQYPGDKSREHVAKCRPMTCDQTLLNVGKQGYLTVQSINMFNSRVDVVFWPKFLEGDLLLVRCTGVIKPQDRAIPGKAHLLA
jgi:hypothetical protein